MKIYVVKHNNLVRMFREEHRNNKTQAVFLVDTLTHERIVMPAEILRAITLKEFEAVDDFGPLVECKRKEEKARYSEAVDHFNALNGYLNEVDDSTPIIAALAIIQDFLEQKERELAWE